jgi:hypothetical protein
VKATSTSLTASRPNLADSRMCDPGATAMSALPYFAKLWPWYSQNTIATKADSYQAVVASVSEWSREISMNAEICEILGSHWRDRRSGWCVSGCYHADFPYAAVTAEHKDYQKGVSVSDG